MATTFYGQWSLDVTGNVGEFPQRLRIIGSVASNGTVSGAVGTHVAAIDGNGWNLIMERSEDGGATWVENLVQQVPGVDPQKGIIMTLYGDDSLVPPAVSDVTVQLVYLNPQVNPKPVQPPFHFTLPRDKFWPPRPTIPCPCCCRRPCTCGKATAGQGAAVSGRRCC